MQHAQLLNTVEDIAIAAGDRILGVYNQADGVAVDFKSDNSPITEADRQAHDLICERLTVLTPDIPVLSEESKPVDFAIRKNWQSYWLVDPLDGTKEFVKRNGEFTVNIALIENGVATLGVVHVPVTGVTYSGASKTGAFVQRGTGDREAIAVTRITESTTRLQIVASRSHRDEQLTRIVQSLREKFAEVNEVSMGSSLKICLLAEGKADFYPRLAPTSEWDTAAAHAVLSAAGGEIVDLQFMPLRYNQKSLLLNPYFLALGDQLFDWRGVLSGQLDKSA